MNPPLIQPLTVADHRRDSAGMTYVYPVLSRRAGGVSIGINLNPNNACNWRCIYCQVPDLVRGTAPDIDIAKLDRELRGFLLEIRNSPAPGGEGDNNSRILRDIAFSGNGEPTSAKNFPEIVSAVGLARNDAGYGPEVPLRLITNGSLVSRPQVLRGIDSLASNGGEVWFKIDAVAPNDQRTINGVHRSRKTTLSYLQMCTSRCPTWIQTCMFALDGIAPSAEAIDRYVELLEQARTSGLMGVLLYGVARPSMQPERDRITQLPEKILEDIAEHIRKTGLPVRVSP